MAQRALPDACLPSLSPIFPFLYVGCQEDALSTETMQKQQITHVINVSITGERAPFLDADDDEHFLRIPINDCLSAKLLPYFDEAYTFIEKARLNNGRVLIHCLAGISRSPALAIAYIIRYLHLSADDAYKYVKQRRPQISPNFNFLGQLYQYECNLKSASSSTPMPVCVQAESPVNDRRFCVQVESRSRADTSIEHRAEPLPRPMCFNFDSINSRRSQTPLTSLSALAQLTLESLTQPQHVSVSESTQSNHSNKERPKPKDDCATVQLINSSYDDSKSKKRAIVRATSSFLEQSDLINSYFHESAMLSKSLEHWQSSASCESNTETITNGVLSTSLEVLVL